MNQIAFIIGDLSLYWTSLLLCLSAAAGICCLAAVYPRQAEERMCFALFVPFALVLSLALGRLIHWYCLPNQYADLLTALTQLSQGSYALMGAVAACLLTAGILRLTGVCTNLPRFLDCLSVAACGAIALGRLSFFYSTQDRGGIVSVTSLPLAYPVVNAVSGTLEYRFATFLFQASALGILFFILLFLLLRKKNPDGDVALVFALVYCALAVVLDSTRYDSLYFRSNGFVSVVQILSCVTLLGIVVFYSVVGIRRSGFKRRYILLWIQELLMFGGGGLMEYYVQRHGREAVFAYTIMSVCLADIVLLTLALRHLAKKQ